jgi:hypothetical protein
MHSLRQLAGHLMACLRQVVHAADPTWNGTGIGDTGEAARAEV